MLQPVGGDASCCTLTFRKSRKPIHLERSAWHLIELRDNIILTMD